MRNKKGYNQSNLKQQINLAETLIAKEKWHCYYRGEDSFKESYNPYSRIFRLYQRLEKYAGMLADLQKTCGQ